MTVQEFYETVGGSYADAKSRLMKDERILKYLRMFGRSEDCAAMLTALEEKRFEDAFRNAHNLKGVSANLSLTPLYQASFELCEALRHGEPTVDISGMLSDVKKAYADVTEALRGLEG